MKYDTILIGGGLCGLVAGITLQKEGQKTAIISAGQSALHFFSGVFDGAAPDDKADDLIRLFDSFGVRLGRGGYWLTAAGGFRKAWLALEDITLLEEPHLGRNALIVNFDGFHDFFPAFLAKALEESGTSCRIASIRIPEVERLRKSPSEMRSVGIARIMDQCWMKAVHQVRALRHHEESVLLPQVFGLRDESVLAKIREALPGVVFAGTMPPSVPGIRTQMRLKKAYEALGGTFLMGDEAVSAAVHEGVVSSVSTRNLEGYRLFADRFVLATGSFFGKGLVSTPTRVYEPLFGLDVDFPEDRNLWYKKDFFDPQPYMGFGVKTTEDLHGIIGGVPVQNLYVAGSLLGQTHPHLGSAAALAIRSALKVAGSILNEAKI